MIPAQPISRFSARRRAILARRDALVLAHLPLARQIARGVLARLPPAFTLDELESTGRLALMAAALRYRPRLNAGTPFAAYARHAVRGAILESVRRNRYTEATRPGVSQIAEPAAKVVDIGVSIDRVRQRRRVAEAISWLTPGEREVLAGYYGAEETFAVIGARVGVSERDACRLHASAIRALRARFKAS